MVGIVLQFLLFNFLPFLPVGLVLFTCVADSAGTAGTAYSKCTYRTACTA
jgi:hypothetical protein